MELDRDGFLDGWRMNAYYQRGSNEQDFDTDNGIRVDRIPLALDAVVNPANGQIVCHAALVNPAVFGDCVPMNIFGGVQNISPAARNYIVDDYKHAQQDTTQDFVEFLMTGDVWDGWGAGAISAAFGASYRCEELDQSTPDPTDEFPATPSGVLLETFGVIPVGVRGLIESHLPGGQPASGIRNVPAGFRGDGNSSSITFSSLRAISGGYDVRDVFGELNIPIVVGRGLGEPVRHQHGGALGRLLGQRRDLGRQGRHELAGHRRGAVARDAVARRARRDAARAVRPDARRRHRQRSGARRRRSRRRASRAATRT